MSSPAPLTTTTRSFVFGLADDDGHIDAAALYGAAEACGFTTTQLRLGLRRMGEADLLTIDGRGRKANIRLTATGLTQRSPDLVWTGVAYRADAGLDDWDLQWHLAAFEIPERQRHARDALRTQIIDLYGGQLSGGLYLSPLGWEPWLLAVADANGITDRLTTFETTTLSHAGHSNPASIAAVVWPVDTIQRDYTAFVNDWRPLLDEIPDNPYQAVRAAFAAAARFETVFRQDPLLPAPLVPRDFAGPAARELFLDLIAALSRHELVANTNLFGSYRRAVGSALDLDQGEFWRTTFEKTSRA